MQLGFSGTELDSVIKGNMLCPYIDSSNCLVSARDWLPSPPPQGGTAQRTVGGEGEGGAVVLVVLHIVKEWVCKTRNRSLGPVG